MTTTVVAEVVVADVDWNNGVSICGTRIVNQ